MLHIQGVLNKLTSTCGYFATMEDNETLPHVRHCSQLLQNDMSTCVILFWRDPINAVCDIVLWRRDFSHYGITKTLIRRISKWVNQLLRTTVWYIVLSLHCSGLSAHLRRDTGQCARVLVFGWFGHPRRSRRRGLAGRSTAEPERWVNMIFALWLILNFRAVSIQWI